MVNGRGWYDDKNIDRAILFHLSRDMLNPDSEDFLCSRSYATDVHRSTLVNTYISL